MIVLSDGVSLFDVFRKKCVVAFYFSFWDVEFVCFRMVFVSVRFAE